MMQPRLPLGINSPGNQRFLLQMSIGAMPHREVLRAIELLGTVVAPQVRRATTHPALSLPGPGRV